MRRDTSALSTNDLKRRAPDRGGIGEAISRRVVTEALRILVIGFHGGIREMERTPKLALLLIWTF